MRSHRSHDSRPDRSRVRHEKCQTLSATGGLHHAVRGTYAVDGVPEENHGVLNVLVATAAALDGAPHDELTGILAGRDAGALAATVRDWSPDTARRVRAALRSYGCCTVTDPVGELADLGVLVAPDP